MKLNFYMTGDKWNIVEITGKVDTDTAPTLEQVCRESIEKGFHWLSMDFNNVTYLSSAGLRVILTLDRLTKEKKGGLAILQPPSFVTNVLEISGFLDFLTILNDPSELT